MRHRPGWDWLLLTLAVCALAAAFVLGAMSMARGAELPRLRPGELELMARIVAAESTGEPEPGARAVAWTIINRLDEPETFGSTVTKVILRPYQYAKPAAIRDNSPAYLKAMLATLKALLGEGGDPSLGSTHFARCDLSKPTKWMRVYELRVRISKHCFYKEID